MIETAGTIQTEELSNIRVSETDNGFVVALIDEQGFEIVKGYGTTISEAINEMHSTLI